MAQDSDWIESRLSFRQKDKGGEVKALAPAEQQSLLEKLKVDLQAKPLPILVLLIHGYNNDYQAAVEAYEDGFKDCQRRIAQDRGNQPIADNRVIGEVFWPGDADWGLLSFLFYMGSIPHALQSSEELARVLNSLCKSIPELKIEIVAHSMGCRFALELLKKLFGLHDRIKCVVLMAAAVPTFKLEDDSRHGTLRTVLENVPIKSLYSGKDIVLSLAFPLGQTFALGDEGTLPTALGHGMWPSGDIHIEQCEVKGAGHSDYWGWEKDPKKKQIGICANTLVRDFLGLSTPSVRVTCSCVLESRSPVAGRATSSRVVGA